MSHKRFRAAYDFLLLREQAGEDCQQLGATWTQMQEEHGPIVVNTQDDEPPPRRRRRGGRRRPPPAP
jgi:poly(A) polymerase